MGILSIDFDLFDRPGQTGCGLKESVLAIVVSQLANTSNRNKNSREKSAANGLQQNSDGPIDNYIMECIQGKIPHTTLENARFELDEYKTINATLRDVFFDGRPAMKLIFEHEDDNQDFKRIILGFLNGSDTYYAGYRMKVKNFDKFLPIFDYMVSTYNFTGTRN